MTRSATAGGTRVVVDAAIGEGVALSVVGAEVHGLRVAAPQPKGHHRAVLRRVFNLQGQPRPRARSGTKKKKKFRAPAYEKALREMQEFYIHEIEQRRWYGFWDVIWAHSSWVLLEMI